MAITSWYPSELPSIIDSSGGNSKLNFYSETNKPSPPSASGNLEKNHVRRRTLGSLPNSMCDQIYRLWTTLCSFDKSGQDSTKISSVAKNDDNQDDSEDELLRHDSYHSGLITRAYLPMRLTLLALGRWPFLLILKSVVTRSDKKSRSRIINRIRVLNYDPSLKSPVWIYFGLTTLFILFVLVMSTLGFFDFFLEWKLLPERRWAIIQKNTFRNNLVMFLLVWGCLVHSTVSSFSMFYNRKMVTKTLNYWNVAAEELQIGQVKSHRRFLIIANLGYVMFLVLIYFAYSWWNVRFVRDGATLFGTLAIRPLLNEEQLNNTEEWKLRVFGIFTIIYCVYASRAFLFMFCFKCRLLRTTFRLWNGRLTKFLRRPDDTNEDLEKVESNRLMRDMTILLKMVRHTDEIFGRIMQSYYAIQLLNMCFELYMLAKSGTAEFTRSGMSEVGLGLTNRSVDIFSALITLFQNVYFFFTVSLDGASVGEEAAEGMEILRRHPISAQSSVHRKYLVYNLGFIYQQRIVLTGGKYFIIDRPFIVTVLGAVLTYFVIILQVEPSLNKEK